MLLLLTLISGTECLLSSKAAKNYLKGIESKSKDVLAEKEIPVVLRKEALDPLETLIHNAITAANQENDTNQDTTRLKAHPLFPLPAWIDSKPCMENQELWVGNRVVSY